MKGVSFSLVGVALFALVVLFVPAVNAERRVRALPTPTPSRTPTPINVGNFVWDDIDHDGRQDAGEPGLAGVVVQLWNSSKTMLYDQATTNANGNYTLIAPTPGAYRVRMILPAIADQFSPKDQAGGQDTLDSDINPSGADVGFTDTLNFAPNLISTTTIDGGIIKYRTPTPTRTPTPVNIGNFVWHDLNGNGVQDAGEPGIGGVVVQLWNSGKTALLDQKMTNANGNYTVVAPTPGEYRVRVILPSGMSFTVKNATTETADSDINPSGTNQGFTDILTIANNVISTTVVDAGLTGTLPASPTPSRTLTRTPTRTPTKTMTPTATRTPDCAVKPAKPVLESPAHQAKTNKVRVMLNWNDVACTAQYKLIVKQDTKSGTLVLKTDVAVSQRKTGVLTRGKTYVWRVKACNPPYGCSASGWRAFSIRP